MPGAESEPEPAADMVTAAGRKSNSTSANPASVPAAIMTCPAVVAVRAPVVGGEHQHPADGRAEEALGFRLQRCQQGRAQPMGREAPLFPIASVRPKLHMMRPA